jgi:hypothetical protein
MGWPPPIDIATQCQLAEGPSDGRASKLPQAREIQLAASALTRFGLFEAGMASAHDPRHTVDPQRRRLEERKGVRPSAQSSRG